MTENEIANKVIGLAIEVHRNFGPGLFEKAYKECLFYKIVKSGLEAVKEKEIPLIYEEVKLDCAYRLDILVENKLLIEIKSVKELKPIDFVQTLTYLRLGDYKLGLLINFNEVLLKNGVNRVINGYLD